MPARLRYSEADLRLSGAWSPVQIAKSRPTFYVRRSQLASHWKLLRLIPKSEHRELSVWVDPLSTSAIRFRSTDLQSLELMDIKPDIMTVQPTSELEPGEYLLVAPLRGQTRTLVGYDFGVTQQAP
jgi:hypothetical protein